MSRTVFDQFGVPDGGPDSAVDIGSDRAHLRWVDTHDVIVSLTPVGADGAAESAGPVTALPEVPGAGDSPAPAVVVTPHHRDELRGAAAAPAPSMVPRTPRHRPGESPEPRLSRRDTVAPTGDHRAVAARGRNGVSAGRAGGADSAPPFTNLQVAWSRTRYGTGQSSSADWVNHVAKAAPQTRQYRAPAWSSGTLTGS